MKFTGDLVYLGYGRRWLQRQNLSKKSSGFIKVGGPDASDVQALLEWEVKNRIWQKQPGCWNYRIDKTGNDALGFIEHNFSSASRLEVAKQRRLRQEKINYPIYGFKVNMGLPRSIWRMGYTVNWKMDDNRHEIKS
jgi:hypothetical protein